MVYRKYVKSNWVILTSHHLQIFTWRHVYKKEPALRSLLKFYNGYRESSKIISIVMVQMQWTEGGGGNLIWWTATNKLHSNVLPINQYSLVQNVATISYNLPDIPATREPEGKFSPSMPWGDSEEKSDSIILNFGTMVPVWRWSASRPGCFTRRERAPSPQWIGCRPGCNFLRWEESCLSQNSNPASSSP